MLFMKRIVVYSENYKKHINTLFGKNAEVRSAKEFVDLSLTASALQKCHEFIYHSPKAINIINKLNG
jgi:hypothetical protein